MSKSGTIFLGRREYLILNAEEATFFDLFQILFSTSLYKRNFLQVTETEELRGRDYRWIIFISVLVQKILIYVKTPLAWIGYIIEGFLNLLSCNGGFFGLIFHFLFAEVLKTERSSAKFRSLTGLLDSRTELDKNIKNGSTRYIPSLSIMASKLSYENEASVQSIIESQWKMEFIGFYNFWNDYKEKYTTEAIMFQDKSAESNLIVVAFRGTDPFNADAWITDIDISWYEIKGIGKIHAGFMKALGLQKDKGWPKDIEQDTDQPPFAYYTIKKKLREMLLKKENENSKFIVTGHSLGGALAILFANLLALHEEEWLLERLEGVYTFGQPRVGNGQFGEFMKEKMRMYNVRYLRYVYCNDMVPRLPYDDSNILYKHIDSCLYFNSFYKGKVLRQEPNKNYFSLLRAIPKNLNAVWELMRSFILPWTRGAVYEEGRFMKSYRVIGILIPGLSAHAPGDSVNLTRIGSDISSHILQQQTNNGNGNGNSISNGIKNE